MSRITPAVYTKAMTSARVYRRELLDKAKKLIEEDEALHRKVIDIDWQALGTIERQCDLLQQLLELN